MKYLFATLMWNERAGMPPELDDIFAVCCQSYGPDGITRYGHYTHLKDMNALTEKTKDAVYHNIAVLKMAKPLGEVIDKVEQTFSEYDVLVVWSREEYELFRWAVHAYGHRLRTAKLVFLKELLEMTIRFDVDMELTFRRALEEFHIQVTNDTYYQAKYRAGFLFELWKRVEQLGEQSKEWAEIELFRNGKSNIVHLPGCSHLGLERSKSCTPQVLLEGAALCKDCQKKKALCIWETRQVHSAEIRAYPAISTAPLNCPPVPKLLYRQGDPDRRYHARFCTCCQRRKEADEYLQWKPLFSEEQARAEGLQACEFCSPMGVRYQKVCTQAEEFCSTRGMECEMQDGILVVETFIGTWKLVAVDDGKMILYHKNVRKNHHTTGVDIPGYHRQRVFKTTIMEYLEYIIQHDLYRKNNPLPGQARLLAEEQEPKATHRGHGHHRSAAGAKHFREHQKSAVKVTTLEELQELAKQRTASTEETEQ